MNADGFSIDSSGPLLAGSNRVTEAGATIGVHVAETVREVIVSPMNVALAREPSANGLSTLRVESAVLPGRTNGADE